MKKKLVRHKNESLGVDLPLLGFGCMRVPEDEQGAIDVKAAAELLHNGLQAGITYFDTAYVYNSCKSEAFLGEHFFSQIPRSSFMVATKMPVFRVKKPQDCETLFKEQLNNLRLDYIDFYLAHSLDKERWQSFKKQQGDDFLRSLKKDGRVGLVGFSYHGLPEDLEEIMEDFPWDFVQLQINYFDWSPQTQNAKLQYEIALAHNMPIIVMEPVRGGGLAALPAEAEAVLSKVNPHASMASWALRWVGSLPGIALILSGMSNQQQLDDNLATFGDFKPLSSEEYQAIEKVLEIIYGQKQVSCTGCNYCLEACPQSIGISTAFERYNDYLRLGHKGILEAYLRWTQPENLPTSCTACGVCKALCPQHVDIPLELEAFNAELRELLG